VGGDGGNEERARLSKGMIAFRQVVGCAGAVVVGCAGDLSNGCDSAMVVGCAGTVVVKCSGCRVCQHSGDLAAGERVSWCIR